MNNKISIRDLALKTMELSNQIIEEKNLKRKRPKSKLSYQDTKDIINVFLNVVSDELKDGNSVRLTGLMVMNPVTVDERLRYDLHSGKFVENPRHTKIKVNFAEKLKRAVYDLVL